MSERYQFDAKDDVILRAAATLLKKVAVAEATKPAQLVSVAKLQHVLSLLPRMASGIDVTVSVSSPRRNFDDIETFHWWEVAVEGERLAISSGGHFFRPSTGGDAFTTMTWAAIPEEPSELDDYRESLWMVPDVRSFPDGVASVNFASGGYRLEVTDEDNPLLEDVEEDLGDETDAQPDDVEEEASGREDEPTVQGTLFSTEGRSGDPIELYRRNEMIELDQQDWHAALLIFQEMGWQPAHPLEAHAHPLTFITHDDGQAMQRAGRSLSTLIQDEPSLSMSVQMDLGLFYRLTEFVGGGAFIVGRPGAYEDAKANDFWQAGLSKPLGSAS